MPPSKNLLHKNFTDTENSVQVESMRSLRVTIFQLECLSRDLKRELGVSRVRRAIFDERIKKPGDSNSAVAVKRR